jgi:hypothetical protein
VKERGKTEFRVDDIVVNELLKQIFSGEIEGRLSLHELKAARSPPEKIGETGALRRRNEFSIVFFAGNEGIEP